MEQMAWEPVHVCKNGHRSKYHERQASGDAKNAVKNAVDLAADAFKKPL